MGSMTLLTAVFLLSGLYLCLAVSSSTESTTLTVATNETTTPDPASSITENATTTNEQAVTATPKDTVNATSTTQTQSTSSITENTTSQATTTNEQAVTGVPKDTVNATTSSITESTTSLGTNNGATTSTEQPVAAATNDTGTTQTQSTSSTTKAATESTASSQTIPSTEKAVTVGSTDKVTGTSTTQAPSTLAVPADFVVTRLGYNNISISWKHGGGEVDKFIVSVGGVKEEYPFTSDETFVQYRTVVPGTVYNISVVSVKNNVESVSSVQQYKASPSTPVSFEVSSHGYRTVTVSWQNGEGPLPDGFVIKQKTGNVITEEERDGTANQTELRVEPGLQYEVSILSNISGILSAEITVTFRALLKCYTCSGTVATCGKVRTTNDPKATCDLNEVCWMRNVVVSGLATYTRKCETTECTSDYQTTKCDTDGSTKTCSMCCTGDACNTELVENRSALYMPGLPLLTACVFMVASTLFVMG